MVGSGYFNAVSRTKLKKKANYLNNMLNPAFEICPINFRKSEKYRKKIIIIIYFK